MEIKATLNKPYEEQEKVDFIIEQNHNNGYEIRETETTLEAWGYTEKEIEEQRREAIDNLELTSADVERAIYESKGMDFSDLVDYVKSLEIEGFDIKRLRIELGANHFVRKHPYVNMIGKLLGYTPNDMDYLFQYKEFPKMEVKENEDRPTDTTTDTVQDEME